MIEKVISGIIGMDREKFGFTLNDSQKDSHKEILWVMNVG